MTQARPPVLMFVVNVAWFFCMHRLHLARAAQAAGFEVHVATAPDSERDVERIRAAGLTYHELALRRGRWSLHEEWHLTRSLYRLYRSVRPDLVHHVTIKPVICGTLAARLAGVPGIVNAMSGLGFVFTAVDRWAAVRRLAVTLAYRILFARSTALRVIFENNDDLSFFTGRRIVRSDRAVLIRGAGVDLERFQAAARRGAPSLVVLPARMLWDKGVREFCEAAATLRASGVQTRFALVGGLDPGNPAAIEQEWIDAQVRSGAVEWWGHREDVVSVYAGADIVCLPSYREGLPTVLIEGAASGCALIATDVPGCREVVIPDRTGLLVPPRDSASLATALRRLLQDPELRARLASAAGRLVAAEFSAAHVRERTLGLYSEMLGSRAPSSSRVSTHEADR
jgi:glycosyltransferase involved in cell wall biosynthesis